MNVDQVAVHYVVRAGLARPRHLIVGTTPHPAVRGLFGFSVQSVPEVPIDELARAGGFRNGEISVVTRDRLQRHGYDVVFPTPGRGVYHATVRVPYPLRPDVAALLSGLFTRRRNPYQIV